MKLSLRAAQSVAWSALAAAISFFAIRAFLHDVFPDSSGNSRISLAIVAGTAIAIMAFPKGSVARALLALAALTTVSFCISFDALDALLDPILEADWPIAILAILLSFWLVPVFAIFLFRDE